MKNKIAYNTPEKPGTVYGGKILKIQELPVYNIVTELIAKGSYGCPVEMPIKYAVDKRGVYLGDVHMANILTKKHGISVFEKRIPDNNIATIGYNLHKRKWFGWSHRAIASFKDKRDAKRFAQSVR